LLLSRERRFVAPAPDGIQPGKQALVMRNLVLQRSQRGRHALGDGWHLAEAEAIRMHAVNAQQAVQGSAAVLQRLCRILECRRRGV
jgi:hypothetical protein